MENQWKKRCVFFASSLVFFNMATLTKHYILQYESYFFIFRVFAFFLKKNVEKRVPKSRPRFSLKNHPKVVPGDPFWDPKRSRINVGEVKKPKNVRKRSILDTVGFWRIFKLKKALAPHSSWLGPSRKLNSKSIEPSRDLISSALSIKSSRSVSYTHLRAHET